MMFREVNIGSLVFLRIIFGILAFADILNTWLYYHLQVDSFNPEGFRFYYYGFEWVRPFPEPFMSAFFFLLCLLALFIIFGWQYRWSTTLFAFGFTYTFLLEKAHYLNHGYLFCWLSFLMIFLPLDREFSLRIWQRPQQRLRTLPFWCLFLPTFFMGVVYFYGGIAKLNGDWLQAMPLKLWLKSKGDAFLIGPLLLTDWAPWFMSYGGLLLDLSAPFLLLFRRTRWIALALILFFHFTNVLVFNIGIFPFLSISLSLLFFPPDFPQRVGRWLRKWFPFLPNGKQWWEQSLEQRKQLLSSKQVSDTAPLWQAPSTILTLISIVALFHLSYPFRHHLFPGDVAWTEEGHRYSWRMMLRAKQGKGKFLVVKANQEEEKIDPCTDLDKKQCRKLFTHPDMILQYAHHLRDKYEKDGEKVAVYAQIKAKLNGRKYQPYIDPTVNLATVDWSFWQHSDWILPLETK